MVSLGKVNLSKVQEKPKLWIIVLLLILFPPAAYWYLGQIRRGFIMWGVAVGVIFAAFVPLIIALFVVSTRSDAIVGFVMLIAYIPIPSINILLRVWFFLDCRDIIRMKKDTTE